VSSEDITEANSSVVMAFPNLAQALHGRPFVLPLPLRQPRR